MKELETMAKLILGNEKPELEALQQMKAQTPEGTRWAAYQNHDLGHPNLGHLQFLAVGPSNTFQEAPAQLPDSHLGIGWRYQFVGLVNLETGEIS